MYRVMIVDDEEPVIESFSFIINKYVSDFTLIGKARSGSEAVRLIRELSPDLVFMDIQMPGMNGIEAIKQIKPLFPDIIFILATAYERFDIAQKAIHLGVFSYLVKPVSRNKILEELDKVKKYLDEKYEEDSNQLKEKQFLKTKRDEMQSDFLSSLIWKNPEKEKWRDFSRLFSINSERAAIYLIGGMTGVTEDVRIDIYSQIVKKIQYKYNCLTTDLGDKLLLLFPEGLSLSDLETQIHTILNDLSPYNLILGVGSVYHYSELTKSFSEAFQPFSDLIDKGDKHKNDQRKIFFIYRSILKSERENGEVLFKEYWIEKFNSDSFDIAKGKMVALFTLLLQNIDNHILIESKTDINPAEEIMPLKNMDQWRKWATGALKKLFDLLEMQKSHSYPPILKKALAYIGKNYNQPLQLSSVAEECMVTGSYLSRLFSEHLDIKFIDYVNRYRINQSVILLKDKNITIKEASWLVGYQDPNYFSRIFRRYMGVSPSDLEKRGAL